MYQCERWEYGAYQHISPRAKGDYHGERGEGVLWPKLSQLVSSDISLNASSNAAISKGSSKSIVGLNMSDRSDGESTAVSLSAVKCRDDPCQGDKISGEGERG